MKAFPHTKHFSDYHDNDNMNGMDLRDYFAGLAMQGLVGRSGRNFTLSDLNDCYVIADEMMKARNSK